MTDPVSLSVLGTATLTEGVKFLFGQATEVLRRRRDRRDAQREQRQGPQVAEPASDGDMVSPVLDGLLRARSVDDAALERAGDRLAELRRRASDYVDGLAPVDPMDTGLLALVEGLREALELVYGQRITFVGEQDRPRTGTPLGVHERQEISTRVGAAVAAGERSIAMGAQYGGVASTGDGLEIHR